MEENKKCFIERCKNDKVHTHGYVEGKNKHWEFFCDIHHKEIHPNFDKGFTEQ